MTASRPPGVFDIIPSDPKDPWKSSHLWHWVEETFRTTARQYGFQEIRTPSFEKTELFQRGIGEGTDIVSKEMYTFKDRGERSLTLRPEGTAPVVRAFIDNNMQALGPVHKLYYIGPMFRYERQQAGRYRQHHQFGAEVFGVSSPEQDVELIDLAHTVYSRLGLRNLKIAINSIGNSESRTLYREKLREYLRAHLDSLSEDSKRRFEENPLRTLDSKDPKDQKIVADAPSILDFLDEESRDQFETVKRLLDRLGIAYTVNDRLVRGLDYYNKIVYEVIAGELGAQNSIGGGGRYDGLLKTLGGPDLPSTGFATGLERVIQTILKQEAHVPAAPRPDIFFIPLGQAASEACIQLVHDLRQNRIACDMDYTGRKLGKVMQYANTINARFVAVIGENELKTGKVQLKEMASGTTQEASLSNLNQLVSSNV